MNSQATATNLLVSDAGNAGGGGVGVGGCQIGVALLCKLRSLGGILPFTDDTCASSMALTNDECYQQGHEDRNLFAMLNIQSAPP